LITPELKAILDDVRQRFANLNKMTILGFLIYPGVLLGGCKPVRKAEANVAVASGTSGRQRTDGPYSAVLSENKLEGKKACCETPPNRAAMMRDANPPPAP
jgi:hypothetical protein